MQKVTLNIKDSAYDKIIYFLQNLSNDVEIINHSTKDLPKSKKSLNLKGIFNQYSDEAKIIEEKCAWKNHIIDKYKKDNL
ncbi:hypothetical protein CRU92_08880 [Arcobacter sp. FW59]|nr:hypothetical protein CRU92_08880 [Arcobacter sp. FW59]